MRKLIGFCVLASAKVGFAAMAPQQAPTPIPRTVVTDDECKLQCLANCAPQDTFCYRGCMDTVCFAANG